MVRIIIALCLLVCATPAQAYFMITAPEYSSEVAGGPFKELVFLDDGTFLRFDSRFCCQTELQSLPVTGPNGLLYQIEHPMITGPLDPGQPIPPDTIVRRQPDGTLVDVWLTTDVLNISPFGTYRNLATAHGNLYLLGLVSTGVQQLDWE